MVIFYLLVVYTLSQIARDTKVTANSLSVQGSSEETHLNFATKKRKSRDFLPIIWWAHQNTAAVNYKPINHIDRRQMGRTLDPKTDCLNITVTAKLQ